MIFILQVASCVLAAVAVPTNRTSCWADGSCRLDDEVALVQSRLDLKRAQADFTDPPNDCIPCSKCTLNEGHTGPTVKAWADKCEGYPVCSWTLRTGLASYIRDKGTCADAPLPQFCSPCGKCTTTGTLLASPDTTSGYSSKCEKTAGCVSRSDVLAPTDSCQEVWDANTLPAGTRAFIFDFDLTISIIHMYNAKSDGIFQVPDQSAAYAHLRRELQNLGQEPEFDMDKYHAMSKELQQMNEDGTDRVQNHVQAQLAKTEDAWTEQDVRDRILGGDVRIADLRLALQTAQTNGWELFVLSFGVEVEINQVLAIAGLADLLPPGHVFGKYITRTRLRPDFPAGMTKAAFIADNIDVDLPVLFDDDEKNVRGCYDTGYCKGVFVGNGLQPAELQLLGALPVGDPAMKQKVHYW